MSDNCLDALAVALDGASRETYLASLQAYIDGAGIRNFKAYEVCEVGRVTKHWRTKRPVSLRPAPVSLWPNILPTLGVAEWLRAAFGSVPVDVSSGYRDPAYNEAVKGAAESVHVRFNALDLLPRGAAPIEVGRALLNHPAAKGMGIGVYRGFVHVDTRARIGYAAPARWSGRGIPDRWWL